MKVVVVGSGIGGISAAYHLVKSGHDVELLEQDARLGGHTYAIEIDGEMVDLGFIMYGDSNPNLKEWFKELGITKPDDTSAIRIPMSLTVKSEEPDDVQLSTRKPFASARAFCDRRIWRLLGDMYKFTWDLMIMYVKPQSLTTREWIAQRRYSPEFYRHYFLAFCAILWTVPDHVILDLPVSQFLQSMSVHASSLYIPMWQLLMGALGRRTACPRHLWWYMGSGYLQPFLKFFSERHQGKVRFNARAALVEKGGKAVVLQTGERIECDHVVLATHAEQAAALIPWSPRGQRSLMQYEFHKSMIYVHRDASLLPEDSSTWSGWNVTITKQGQYIPTYWLNRIHRLKSKTPLFMTILPSDFDGDKPDASLTLTSFPWDHPQLLANCAPQDEILQEDGITLSGAWLGYGFHEDGFVAGRRAALMVSKPKHTKTRLYEDPANVPMFAVRAFAPPVTLKSAGIAILGVAAATKLTQHLAQKVRRLRSVTPI